MTYGMSATTWVQLPDSLRIRTGGCWQERCYPFRGVMAEERMEGQVERKRMLEDCRLAMQEFKEYFESPLLEHADE